MPDHKSADTSRARERIARALEGLQFGAVEITVHNGRIVQIERREKLRLESPAVSVSAKSLEQTD